MKLKVKNTQANKSQLEDNNVPFTTSKSGKILSITVNDYHKMWIENGQMSIAKYKKNVLGL